MDGITQTIIVADAIIIGGMGIFWVHYLRKQHKRRVARMAAMVPCICCHFFDASVEGCGLWYGLPRDVSDGCLHGERIGDGADEQLPQFFEGPPLDITGGIDPATYIEQQQGGR